MTIGSKVNRYQGSFSALASFANLRNAKFLGTHSYLHLAPGHAEIGWAPVDHLRLLFGEPCSDWRDELKRFAHSAELLGSKAFGYIGFDAIDSYVGTLPDKSVSGRPLVEFIIPGELLRFSDSEVTHHTQGDNELTQYLVATMPPIPANNGGPPVPVKGTPDQAFVDAVRNGISAITAGQASKIVLSRYEAYEADFDPVTLLATLSGPSVDTFLLCFGDLIAVVPSPELLLEGKCRRILTNPLAGTRPRGKSSDEDERMRIELTENHKEIVEHVLSVKTVISELKPLCKEGQLSVTRFMEVAPLAKVQHLSSIIEATLDPQREILDALWALFPAVTMTGLPKTSAIKILRTLEHSPRYLYAGVIGWVCGSGDCRFSLAIRGIFRCGNRSFLQAGAGILAESSPEAELLETSHKLTAMKEALGRAI